MGKRVLNGVSLIETHHHQNVTPSSPTTRKIRKRKANTVHNIQGTIKNLRLNESNGEWRNNYNNNNNIDSSNDEPLKTMLDTSHHNHKITTKHGNNSSLKLNTTLEDVVVKDHNNSSIIESPKPVYTLRPSIVNGCVLYDLKQKPWRLGRPIGKGNFGEIFLASDNITTPVTNENAKFVVKIEPHSNGPLFVEIHCLMNTAKNNCQYKMENFTQVPILNPEYLNLPQNPPSGIPNYIASGSHKFADARYRFLVLPRFDRDLHSLIKNCRVSPKCVLILAIQIINVLENLHNSGYCHNDVKAQNLMITKCKYLMQKQEENHHQPAFSKCKKSSLNVKESFKTKSSRIYKAKEKYEEKQQTTDSGNSSEQEIREEEEYEDSKSFVLRRRLYNNVAMSCSDNDDEDDEDFDDGGTTTNSSSIDMYHRTPLQRPQKRLTNKVTQQKIPLSTMRSCRRRQRRQGNTTTYADIINSHNLRPTKRISYSEFFNEDGGSDVKSTSGEKDVSKNVHNNISDDDSEDFMPPSLRRTATKVRCNRDLSCKTKRLTRNQEKLLSNTCKKEETKIHKTSADAANCCEASSEPNKFYAHEQEHIFLIDYGLASKYMDNGVHRPFVMDQRRAHDGTLEFTSRDAHMGAHSRRSDLECLGYNLLFWSQGYLPWKDVASNQQPEKVHRAKECLMLNVKDILREIYGQQIPKYLGEFLHMIGQLSYNEKPDYNRYRCLFEQEYKHLGYTKDDMQLSIEEIACTCTRFKAADVEAKTDFFKMNDIGTTAQRVALNLMHNLSVGCTPIHERTFANRVSPKNLRSKSCKKNPAKKSFSWTEILSQDPDQIARERAEKEFEREESFMGQQQQQLIRKYEGKPTYAIKEILKRVKQNERSIDVQEIKEKLNLNLKEQEECLRIVEIPINHKKNSEKMEKIDSVDNLQKKFFNKKMVLDTPNKPQQALTPIKHLTRSKQNIKKTESSINRKRCKYGKAVEEEEQEEKQKETLISQPVKITRRTRRCLMKTDLQHTNTKLKTDTNSNKKNL